MNLYCKYSFSFVFLFISFCGSAFAEKPKEVAVVNSPNVNVTNQTLDVNIVESDAVIEIDTTTPLATEISNGDSNPVPVTVENPVVVEAEQFLIEYQVVGLTSTTWDGDWGGILRMHQICAAEFGPGARVAFSVEFMRTVFPSGSQGTGGWLLPTNTTPLYRPDLNDPDRVWSAYEAGGGFSSGALVGAVDGAVDDPRGAMENLMNCKGYTTDTFNQSGLIGTRRGARTSPCNEFRSITCAAPVAVPVTLAVP